MTKLMVPLVSKSAQVGIPEPCPVRDGTTSNCYPTSQQVRAQIQMAIRNNATEKAHVSLTYHILSPTLMPWG